MAYSSRYCVLGFDGRDIYSLTLTLVSGASPLSAAEMHEHLVQDFGFLWVPEYKFFVDDHTNLGPGSAAPVEKLEF